MHASRATAVASSQASAVSGLHPGQARELHESGNAATFHSQRHASIDGGAGGPSSSRSISHDVPMSATNLVRMETDSIVGAASAVKSVALRASVLGWLAGGLESHVDNPMEHASILAEGPRDPVWWAIAQSLGVRWTGLRPLLPPPDDAEHAFG